VFEGEAIRVCNRYLENTDKAMWPTLIGMHPVMDQVLGRAFKEN